MLLPPADGIGWVVSMQYTDERYLSMVPAVLKERTDITLSFLPCRGLSANRNNALANAKGDILLIADDDCRYSADALRQVQQFYENNPSFDVVCFAAADYNNVPLKAYPSSLLSYKQALKHGYYPCSVEISMQRHVRTRFDERFGLGSPLLCAGEEDVFLKDAVTGGYRVVVSPLCVVKTNPVTTGCFFLENKQLQITKGAVFQHLFGTVEALWRSIKEAGYYFIRLHANPFPILYNMVRGIWILR